MVGLVDNYEKSLWKLVAVLVSVYAHGFFQMIGAVGHNKSNWQKPVMVSVSFDAQEVFQMVGAVGHNKLSWLKPVVVSVFVFVDEKAFSKCFLQWVTKKSSWKKTVVALVSVDAQGVCQMVGTVAHYKSSWWKLVLVLVSVDAQGAFQIVGTVVHKKSSWKNPVVVLVDAHGVCQRGVSSIVKMDCSLESNFWMKMVATLGVGHLEMSWAIWGGSGYIFSQYLAMVHWFNCFTP